MINYILIGMPGSGKTTKGKILAKMFGMNFIDTDDCFLSSTGQKPSDIVESYGRDEFIRIQDKLISALGFNDSVIATGGGIIYSVVAMERLKENGFVIFLNVPFALISERMDRSRKLSGEIGKSLEDIYYERLPLYKKFADVEIMCDDKEADEIISEIKMEINRRNKNDG